MKTNYRWKKKIFSNTLSIYNNNRLIGFIKKNIFSQQSLVDIKNNKYLFNQKNFFNHETEIRNSEKALIGNIKYNTWRNKASITIENHQYQWQYKNTWNTKWEIKNNNNLEISYHSSNHSIEYKREKDTEADDLQLLVGLYIHNRYQQTTYAVLICIFFPIIVRSFLVK